MSLLASDPPPNVTNMRVTFACPKPTPTRPPNHVIVTGCVFGLAWATFTFEQRCFIIAVYKWKKIPTHEDYEDLTTVVKSS